LNHYGVNLVTRKGKEGKVEEKTRSVRAQNRISERQKDRIIDPKVAEQFGQQRLFACISSRPGQSGRADGYILEGKELEFYAKKIESRKK
jgi:small subunit ribosomal protein S8e